MVVITITRLRPSRHQHRGAGNRIGVHDPLQIPEVSGKHAFQFRKDHRNAGDFEAEQQRGKANPRKRYGVSLNLKNHIHHFLSACSELGGGGSSNCGRNEIDEA
jgi:hypothetical protein